MNEQKNLNVGNGEYFGPDDELSVDIQKECIARAKAELIDTKGFDLFLNLEKDDQDLREHGQEISLISFLGPYDSLKAKHETLLFNIRGCCDTVDKTRKKLTDIEKITKKYDIYTFEMYTWIAIPPNPEFMEDNDKHELYLNKIICDHKLKLQVDKELFETRKRLMTTNPDLNSEPNKIKDEVEKVEKVEEVEKVEKVEEIEEVEEIVTISKTDVSSIKDNVEELDAKEKLDECKNYGQDWAVISIVGTDILGRALKVKGFYETEDEARVKSEMLTGVDNTFDNYIVACYSWLKADIKPDEIDDQVYDNEELNNMNKEHKSQKNKALQTLSKNPPKEVTASSLLSDME
jgi:hypothetical protein